MGIHMMGGAGGVWFALGMVSVFCFCIDRRFKALSCTLAGMTFLQATTSVFAAYNAWTKSEAMGPEKLGAYPLKDAYNNTSWMWSVAFAMATVFFFIHFILQNLGYIDPPIYDDADAEPAKGVEPVPTTSVEMTETVDVSVEAEA